MEWIETMTLAGEYTTMIRRAAKKRGKARTSLVRRAPKLRSRMVNPKKGRKALYNIRQSKEGKKGLARFRKFWGLNTPPEIHAVDFPGNKKTVLVGMGRSPNAILADGPMGRAKNVRKVKGSFLVATDTKGKRIFLLKRGKRMRVGNKLKHVGWAPETHYIPTAAMEKAGTFKKGKYWVHEHSDEGGTWPKVFKDQFGNYVYAPSTYSVGKWIRR